MGDLPMRHAWVILLAVLLTSPARAAAAPAAAVPDLAGTWQGTLDVGPDRLRVVWLISSDSSGAWQLLGYSINQGTEPVKASAVTLEGTTVKVTVDAIGGVYEGTLSPDRQSMEGAWTTRDVKTPLVLHRATKRSAWQVDPSRHKVRFVTVDHDVSLEVLDWGGKGRPVVLLTGLGNNAHVYDQFAPKLVASYHVLAITRRGFGASSAPPGGYSADRLGDDVLEVLQALKISRPILMGHSIAGEELSSIGTRHPEAVAGLVYLDAGYAYAFYSGGDLSFDIAELRRKLDDLEKGHARVAQQLLATDLPRLTKDLQRIPKDADGPLPSGPTFVGPPPPPVSQAIFAGERKFSAISAVPILAIFADPPYNGPRPAPDPAAQAAREAQGKAIVEPQVVAFEEAMPAAHVVRLAHANHYVFRSNEADVLREVNAFIAGLPPAP
jgi:pimeloyl-ACP methyl ester carboxylesterase